MLSQGGVKVSSRMHHIIAVSILTDPFPFVGTVEDILTEEGELNGKKVKASKDDPRIVLKSSSGGKLAQHKPEQVYFD